jgi:hypothetical protein
MPFETGHEAEAAASRVTYLTGLVRPVNRPCKTGWISKCRRRGGTCIIRFAAERPSQRLAEDPDSASPATCRKSGSFASDIVHVIDCYRGGKGPKTDFFVRSLPLLPRSRVILSASIYRPGTGKQLSKSLRRSRASSRRARGRRNTASTYLGRRFSTAALIRSKTSSGVPRASMMARIPLKR